METVFLKNLREKIPFETLPAASQDSLKELSRQLQSDFASSLGGYFSLEDQKRISQEAATRLVQAMTPDIESSPIREEWRKIVTDFHQNQHWGFQTQKQKPAKAPSEEQRRLREIAPYIGIAFQAWIVMKLIIYYFGIEAADNPDETPWVLYFAIAFSFGSLMVFAWSKYRKGD